MNLAKMLSPVVGIVALAAYIPVATAATATGTFNTNITLTSGCSINGAISDISLTYTSFQGAASTGTTSFNVRCTNTLPITSVALDSTSITDDAVNLAYTLGLTGVPTTGNGTNQAVTVTATVASGQSGTCASASCNNSTATNKTRTVTITY